MTALHRLLAVAAGCGGGWWSGTTEVDYVGRKLVRSSAGGLVKVSTVTLLAAVLPAACIGGTRPL